MFFAITPNGSPSIRLYSRCRQCSQRPELPNTPRTGGANAPPEVLTGTLPADGFINSRGRRRGSRPLTMIRLSCPRNERRNRRSRGRLLGAAPGRGRNHRGRRRRELRIDGNGPRHHAAVHGAVIAVGAGRGGLPGEGRSGSEHSRVETAVGCASAVVVVAADVSALSGGRRMSAGLEDPLNRLADAH